MSGEQVVGVVVLVVFFPFWLISTLLLFNERFVYNIKARGPILTLLGQNVLVGFLLLMSAADLVAAVPSNDCGRLYFSLALNYLVNLLPLVYAMRCWVLMFRYRIASVLGEYGSQRQLDLQLETQHLQAPQPEHRGHRGATQVSARTRHLWYVHHRHWISPPVLSRVLVIGWVVSISVPTVLAMTEPECGYRANFIFAGASVAFWSLVIMVFSCYINSEPRDVFGIKLELRQISITSVTSFILLILGLIVLPTRLTFNSTVIIACLFVWTFSCLVPIYQARQSWSKPDFVGLYEIKSLYDLLALDIGYVSFLEYCKREFAQENLLFWKDAHLFRGRYLVNDYEAFASREKCLLEAEQLFARYIDHNAPFQVNLPGEVLNSLRESLQRERAARPTETEALTTHSLARMFDRALDNVFSLMNDDLLPRYIQSQEFMGFVQELKQNIDQTNDKSQPITISSPTVAAASISRAAGRPSLLGPPRNQRENSPSPSQSSRRATTPSSLAPPTSNSPPSSPPTPTSSVPLELLPIPSIDSSSMSAKYPSIYDNLAYNSGGVADKDRDDQSITTGHGSLKRPGNVSAIPVSSSSSSLTPTLPARTRTSSTASSASNASNASNTLPITSKKSSSFIDTASVLPKKSSNASSHSMINIPNPTNPTHHPKHSSNSPSVMLDPTFGLGGSSSAMFSLDRIAVVGGLGEKQLIINSNNND